MPADKGIAGTVVQTGQSLLVPDVHRDPRFYSQVDQQTGGETQSILCAPLRTQHGIIGVIECINKREGEFTQTDLTFLEALAATIAVSIENARLYETLKRSEARLRDEVALLARERPVRTRFADIVGSGPAMEKVFRLVESAITSPITVLLQGETGTGKEVIARAIHFEGPRKDKPFVAVNCGAFTETLLESELFGYRKGAFTGADGRQARALRSRGRRHDVPRRDRRHAADAAGQAAARPGTRRVHPGRRHAGAPGRYARHLRQQQGPAGGGARRPLSRGSLLSPQRLSRSTCRRCASVAKISRCSSPTCSSASRTSGARERSASRRGHGLPGALRVARQRARAGARDRARRHPGGRVNDAAAGAFLGAHSQRRRPAAAASASAARSSRRAPPSRRSTSPTCCGRTTATSPTPRAPWASAA